MTDRRDFLKHGAALAALVGSARDAKALTRLVSGGGPPLPPEAVPDPQQVKALMAEALNAAKASGAS